jgi:hypothetical protein
MLRSIRPAAILLVVASIGCDGSASPDGWTPVAPDEAARARQILATAELPDIDPENFGGVPLGGVTGMAETPHGLVVAGVSSHVDLFWDAWLVPSDGRSPRRLAPIGDNLIAVDAGGALWTTIVSEDDSGDIESQVRLSPADGSPSVPLSPALPGTFSAERALPDGDGRRLLIGCEGLDDGTTHAAVFAVAADGAVARVAWDPAPEAPIVVNAAVASGALYLALQYDPSGPPAIVKVPLR